MDDAEKDKLITDNKEEQNNIDNNTITTMNTIDENSMEDSIEEKLGETTIDDFDRIFDLDEKAG